MNALGAAALDYAKRGNPIFPCVGKAPLTGPGGFKHATADRDQVEQWWREHPNANIGFVPEAAGLLALDLDSVAAETVAISLGAMAEPCPTVATGRRALPPEHPNRFARAAHLYFRVPEDLQGRFTRTSLGPGNALDVRHAGCYVLLPPSVHPESGMTYTWEDKSPAGELPPALLEAIRAAVAPHTPSLPREPLPDLIPVGRRDQTLTRLAGALRRCGASERMILTALRGWNDSHLAEPLPARDLERIARSIGRYPPAASPSRFDAWLAESASTAREYADG